MSDFPAEIDPLELFRQELEERIDTLNQALLVLEEQPESGEDCDRMMRALHAVKGAAGIVGLQPLVQLSHRLEDLFVAVRSGAVPLLPAAITASFRSIDLLADLSRLPAAAIPDWLEARREAIAELEAELEPLLAAAPAPAAASQATAGSAGESPRAPAPPLAAQAPSTAVGPADPALPGPAPGPLSEEAPPSAAGSGAAAAADRVVRVEAENLNRIMALSGEMLVEAKWLQPFADSLALLRERQKELQADIEALRLQLSRRDDPGSLALVEKARLSERHCRETLSERLGDLELYALRTTNLSYRLYREVIGSNMRPFADALQPFPRLVRDLARRLGKQVQLEMVGKGTLVDRDILRKLEAPLTHILRNAVDHGIEPPDQRIAAGKPAHGTIRVEAMHRGGQLAITISDDGRGVQFDQVRRRLSERGLVSPEQAALLSEAELCEALQQPGFSTAAQVTDLSGRGVGLDVVSAMAQEVGGAVRLSSTAGSGTSLHFQLPLALSVVRTLLVEINGEPYAFPLARLDQIVAIEPRQIALMEGRPCFDLNGVVIGLISARRVLGFPEEDPADATLPVVVISDHAKVYGVVVDRYLGEQDLVVRPLDPRLGKVDNISAAALMGDGQPILIVDTNELVASINAQLQTSDLLVPSWQQDSRVSPHVLIVDDSPLALDLQARLLSSRGYRVARAADGFEAWQVLCNGDHQLVVTDVDMPGMDGLSLIRTIRREARLQHLPIIVCSARGSEQDRLEGMEAGADYYLVKDSQLEQALPAAIHQLIGPA
ncbi:MAG: response regulator [Synechococcaceae cyanobacterium]|nr:response regulator [Synechococcaceae cyanobacterium]